MISPSGSKFPLLLAVLVAAGCFATSGCGSRADTEASSTQPEAATVAPSPEKPLDPAVVAWLTQKNKPCPYRADSGMILAAVVREENYIVYCYELDEEQYDIEDLREETYRRGVDMLRQLRTPALAHDIGVMAENDMGLIFQYVGNNSGKTARIRFTPNEIKSLAALPAEPAHITDSRL